MNGQNVNVMTEEKNSQNINRLTAAEAERLALLAEECGEVIQVVGKILRHGYDSSNPLVDISPTNRQELQKELGDVELVISMMKLKGDVDGAEIQRRREDKAIKIVRWLHHQD